MYSIWIWIYVLILIIWRGTSTSSISDVPWPSSPWGIRLNYRPCQIPSSWCCCQTRPWQPFRADPQNHHWWPAKEGKLMVHTPKKKCLILGTSGFPEIAYDMCVCVSDFVCVCAYCLADTMCRFQPFVSRTGLLRRRFETMPSFTRLFGSGNDCIMRCLQGLRMELVLK